MSIAAYTVGKYGVEPVEPDPLDPRGILWVWEEPSAFADYVIGVDPTMGIVGWNRLLRSDGDEKVDNAAIEIFRKGNRSKGEPDRQVAEWAGPLDAEDLADICNYIGRLYCGRNEDSQALMAIEIYPGTGWLTQRNLINKFGYMNMPPWLVEDGISQRMTHKLGWISNQNTRRDLWVRGASQLNRKNVILRSPWLVEEMVDCTPDNFLAVTARSQGGRHDDRVVASLISIWFLNEWEIGGDPTEPTGPAKDSNAASWQGSAISARDMMAEWNDIVSAMGEED